MKKRALCALLALVLAFSLLPVPAYAAGGVKINKTNFPDANFRSYVKGFDSNNNGFLSDAEIATVTNMFPYNRGIASLKGIEHFTALVALDCSSNELKTIDVSKNTALKELYCGYNKLTALDLSKNTKLKSFGCPFNSIKTLDVSRCTRLEYLDCWSNLLTGLDVTKNTKLKVLMCGKNKIKTLDVSKNTRLVQLDCSMAELTKLDVSKNPELEALYCGYNNIASLNISANPILICTYLKGKRNADTVISYTLGDHDEYALYVDYGTGVTGYQPKVTTQPKNQVVSAGNAAIFTVEARGEYLEYQWYRMRDDETAWKPMSGETDPVLIVYTSQYDTVGSRYYCGITSRGSRETAATISDTAHLTFMQIPSITTQPRSASVAAGKTVTFKVKAAGGGLKYQWFVMKRGSSSWAKLSGKTTATLKLTAKKTMNGYKYKCQVRNDRGRIDTAVVKLTVK